MLGPGQILSHSFDEESYGAFYTRGEPLTLQGWEKQKKEWKKQEEERKERRKVAKEEKRRAE